MIANQSFLTLLTMWVVVAFSIQVQVDAQRSRIENEFFQRNSMRQNLSADRSVRIAKGFDQTISANRRAPFSPDVNQVKTLATNLKGFGVPFKINASNVSFIEVQLYLSRDQGRSWQFQTRQSTDGRDFPFQAVEDGEYWFALKTLNHDRKLLPEGIPQPELKIIVDTVKPNLDFRVGTDAAGRVICRWRAEDKNLVPKTLKIFYQPITKTGVVKNWIRVPVNLGGIARSGVYADQLAWWPETTEQMLNVAVEIKDIAGNVVQLDRQVVVPQTAWRKRNQSTAQITDAPRSQNTSLRNPWATTDLIPAHSKQRPIQSTTTPPKTAQHSSNVVCKDGLCTVIPSPQRIAKRLDPTIIQTGGSSGTKTKTVGSDVKFVDPPIPAGYVVSENRRVASPLPVGHRPSRVAQVPDTSNRRENTGSVVWPSQSESWGPKNNFSSSTTRQPDPSVAPHPFPEQPKRLPVTTVPANPATTSLLGDQVVSQSTTMGPNNQYRGLNTQGNVPIPSPELLPKFSTDVTRSVEGFRSTQQSNNNRAGVWNPPPNQNRNSGPPRGPSEFANAGFTNLQPRRQANHLRASERPVRESRAPSQIIGTKRFRLNYGIDSIDPSGVARVDLWMTRDEGQTWNAWGSDPDNQSPFPVEIQEQGRYGFKIVVHSKDGLTGQGPSSGDDADMWVLVDTQAPLTRITSVPYGRRNEAGRLVINYSVSDDFLTRRPITLGYSANPDGPWTIIEDGARNEGRYVWKVQPNVPDRVFLRIEAIDKAGNVGIHGLSQSIDVSGLVPRGTILGVVPVDTSR